MVGIGIDVGGGSRFRGAAVVEFVAAAAAGALLGAVGVFEEIPGVGGTGALAFDLPSAVTVVVGMGKDFAAGAGDSGTAAGVGGGTGFSGSGGIFAKWRFTISRIRICSC